MMIGQLAGQGAFVTGGGQGIGLGIARRLAGAGAAVMLADSDLAAARRGAAEICAAGGRAMAMAVDVRHFSDLERMVAATEAAFGSVDIAVNCAGVISVMTVEEMPEAEWDRIMDVNAKGVFLGCKAVLPIMKRAGFGRIINISSVSGKEGYQGLAHYSASKYAVLGLSNSLAKELAGDGITVNAICPGMVRTAMWDILADSYRDEGESREQSWRRQLLAFTPQGRPQAAEEVGDLVVCLVGLPSITGQAINIDGGLTSH